MPAAVVLICEGNMGTDPVALTQNASCQEDLRSPGAGVHLEQGVCLDRASSCCLPPLGAPVVKPSRGT